METDLRRMVMAFRITELQSLLAFAGRNKTGRKTELQQRALALVQSNQGHVGKKIKELHWNFCIRSSSNSSRHYRTTSGFADAYENVLQGRPPCRKHISMRKTRSSSNNNNNMVYVSLPIRPDVKFKQLPFYDIMYELIKPTTLISNEPERMQECTFPFSLTPFQASEIMASKTILEGSQYAYGRELKIGYKIQVQLRLCHLDPSIEQTDNFPSSLCVRMNGMIVISCNPGTEAKCPPKPLNLTNYVKSSPFCINTLSITWASDGKCRGWVMCLNLVKKLTSANLLTRLKAKGPLPPDFTQRMIKEMLSLLTIDDGDCQIAVTSLRASTACPLGKCRMTQPCRASTCFHLQCFDVNSFLQVNEKKPTWACPVCGRQITFENLSIDGYFLGVISALSIDAGNEIEVLPDGTWKPIIVIQKEKEDGSPSKTQRMMAEDLDSTMCLDNEFLIDDTPGLSSSDFARDSSRKENNNNNNKATKTVEAVDMALLDWEDDESKISSATNNTNSNTTNSNTYKYGTS